MRTDTQTLITAMRHLAATIQSGDGVANAAIAEAADRLGELLDEMPHAIDKLNADIEKAGQRVAKVRKRVDCGLTDASHLAYEEGLMHGMESAKITLGDIASRIG
jgi:hypothetical protein